MKSVVILQPQFFPWRGVFEQMRLAQVYVHFTDVAPPQGRSMLNRVQIKTAQGSQWLTVPVRKGSAWIQDMRTDETQPWREKHLRTLEQAYAQAPFSDQMLELVRTLYANPTDNLCEFNIQALETIARFLNLDCDFVRSTDFPPAAGADRLLQISQALAASGYITGHGALNYLKREPFEQQGISVNVMDYRRSPYPQLFGEFDPHTSILDLIANTGIEAAAFLDSPCTEWKEYERNRNT